MYTLVRLLSVKRLTYEQLPAIGLAWLIAEMFKFHSFTLSAWRSLLRGLSSMQRFSC
jgi:hypothetical protein